ncbi:hypothetical protein ABFA07_002846 [Porites harrisoni]
MANEVCRVWSRRSNRFLEFRPTNPSNNGSATDNLACNHGEVKASGKEGLGNLDKITFRTGQNDVTPHRSFHLVFEEAHPNFYHGLDIDSKDNLLLKCWPKGEDRSNETSLQFQEVQVNGGPHIYLVALKKSWSEKSDSLFLASSSDGTLSLRPYHHLDEPHPDEFFLKTNV